MKKFFEFIFGATFFVGICIGLFFLDKRNGGAVVGPNGFVADLFRTRPRPSFEVGVSNRGVREYEFEFSNTTPEGDLSDVELQLTFIPESGAPVEFSPTYGHWKKDEIKKLTVRSGLYKRVNMKGKAKVGEQSVPIDYYFTWTKPLAAAPLRDFEANFERGPLQHQFKMKNETSQGNLTDVHVQASFYPESGSPVEAKGAWDTWTHGEKKSISVEAGNYKRVQLKGTCKVEGQEVQIDSEWTWNKTVTVLPLTEFSCDFNYGLVNHQFEMTNENSVGNLSHVDLTLTFYPDQPESASPVSSSPVELKQSWRSWAKGEKKSITVPSDRYQRVTLKGAALFAEKNLVIDTYFTWDKPYRPAVTGFGATIRESSTDKGTLIFTNNCQAGTLRNIEVKIQLTRNDGVKETMDVIWPEWKWEEKKELSVLFNKFQGYTITGRATIEGREVQVDDSGTWTWK